MPETQQLRSGVISISALRNGFFEHRAIHQAIAGQSLPEVRLIYLVPVLSRHQVGDEAFA